MRRDSLTLPLRHLLLAAGVMLVFQASALARPGSKTADKAGPDWRIVAASGHVESRRHAAVALPWQAASRGQALPASSWVRTGPDGRATVVQRNHIVIVDPDTEIQLIPASGPDVPTRVRQASGSATYRIQKARHQKFQVITPYLVAGVKGTVFRVEVTDSFARLDVTEGVVAVWSRDSDELLDLRVGESIRVDAAPGQRPQITRGDGTEVGERPAGHRGEGDPADPRPGFLERSPKTDDLPTRPGGEPERRLRDAGEPKRDFLRDGTESSGNDFDNFDKKVFKNLLTQFVDDLQTFSSFDNGFDTTQDLDTELKLREGQLAGTIPGATPGP